MIDDGESVSPPSTPLSSGIRLIPDVDRDDPDHGGQANGNGPSGVVGSLKKRRKLSNDSSSQYGDFSGLLTGSLLDGYRFIEKFNRDMMDQFLDYQRRVAASQIRWEQERYRQEQLATEHWRQETREHEKQMFTIFCGVLSQCNSALNILLKARLDQGDQESLRRPPTSASSSTSKMDQSSSSSSGAEDKSPPSSSSGQENSASN